MKLADEVRRSRRPARPEGLTAAKRLRLKGLTRREAEVALMAGQGFHVCEIARQLTVTPGTVKTLLARARDKLDCRNVRELTAVLLRDGVIQPDNLLDPCEGRAKKR